MAAARIAPLERRPQSQGAGNVWCFHPPYSRRKRWFGNAIVKAAIDAGRLRVEGDRLVIVDED